jgi:hypothetical protein
MVFQFWNDSFVCFSFCLTKYFVAENYNFKINHKNSSLIKSIFLQLYFPEKSRQKNGVIH